MLESIISLYEAENVPFSVFDFAMAPVHDTIFSQVSENFVRCKAWLAAKPQNI